MAWKLHAIEQTQLRRHHRVEGVRRLNLISTQVGARQWLHSDASGGGEARAAKRPRAAAPAPAPPAATEAAAEAAAQVMIATLHEALAGPRPPTLAELRQRAPAVYSVVARAAEASLAPAPAAPAPVPPPPPQD